MLRALGKDLSAGLAPTAINLYRVEEHRAPNSAGTKASAAPVSNGTASANAGDDTKGRVGDNKSAVAGVLITVLVVVVGGLVGIIFFRR